MKNNLLTSKFVLSLLTVGIFASCGKSPANSDPNTNISSLDQSNFSSQEMKNMHFTFYIDSTDKASLLLKKQNQDVYASKGKIGTYAQVVVSDNSVFCKFESRSIANFDSLKASIKSVGVTFPATSTNSGTANMTGRLLEFVEFNLNSKKDLSIYCAKLFENSQPLKVEDVKKSLAGIFKLSIY